MSNWSAPKHTAVLVLEDGTALFGFGVGSTGETVGEVCFNTSMTGYQEILTDPSYSEQIVTFTFPHIGNVGTNDEDIETSNPSKGAARGLIIREAITNPSNYRSQTHFDAWLKQHQLIGISGVDTRAITIQIRENGMFNAAIAHNPSGEFDIPALQKKAMSFHGLEGADLASDVTTDNPYDWQQALWKWNAGFEDGTPRKHVVAIDYGIKRNILRSLAAVGLNITVVPASATFESIEALNADGYFLSNGPGDPAATGTHALETIKQLVASGKPVFGICLGHQLLGLALGANTIKMPQGHHGANHPVKDLTTGKVEITSMNHGFAIDTQSLPNGISQTHVSLFDGSNCGIQLNDKPVFSVQYHPEASPGPQDSHYLFERFVAALEN
jgi:carbamoyl-phosphate synthase small subunit